MNERNSEKLRKASSGGSVIAAMTASLCCLGPLAAVMLGAGGFAFSAALAKWRPAALGVTFSLLALAWYLVYRKSKSACADGQACASRPGSKWNQTVLWFVTGVALVAAAFPSLSSAMLRAKPDAASGAPLTTTGANTATLRIKIPEMDCAACALGIQAALKRQTGVQNAQVSFEGKTTVVQYDATRISPKEIIAAINQTGFKVEPATQKETP